MTLNTDFYITTPGINPDTVWNALLDMVEPEDFPRDRTEYTRTIQEAWVSNGTITTATKLGIGLKALCSMSHREDGYVIPLESDETDNVRLSYDESPSSDLAYVPQSYIRVDFDTPYSYRGPGGEGCSDLHGRIVTHLAEIVTAQGAEYIWKDEFAGKWFTDLSHIPEFGRA